MPIVYVTPGPWGAGKGAPVTAAEADGNFWHLVKRLQAVEDNAPVPPGIVEIAVSAGLMRIFASNGVMYGPLALPAAQFRWRGEWQDATAYAAMDVVYVDYEGVFLALADHVSSAPFDPDLATTEGPVWHKAFGLVPGGTSQVRDVTTDTYGLQLADAAHFLRFTHVDGCAVTVPTNGTVAFPVATEIALRQSGGDGPGSAVTIAAAGGVTILPVEGREPATDFRGAVVRLKKTGTNEWAVWGDLAAAEPGTESPTA